MDLTNIIKKHFLFLVNSDFSLNFYDYEKIQYIFEFENQYSCKITISIDFRERYVDIKLKNGNKILLTIEYGNIMENHSFNGLNEMLSEVNKVYENAKGRYKRFTTKDVSSIIKIYSEFVELNFNSILSHTEDSIKNSSDMKI